MLQKNDVASEIRISGKVSGARIILHSSNSLPLRCQNVVNVATKQNNFLKNTLNDYVTNRNAYGRYLLPYEIFNFNHGSWDLMLMSDLQELISILAVTARDQLTSN